MSTDFAQDAAYVVQLLLGGVFLLAALPKLRDLGEFRRIVAAYDVLPPRGAEVVAPAVAAGELVLAVAFLTGWAAAVALVPAGALLAAFAVATIVNLRRGRTIRCGCFGDPAELITPRSLVRLGLLGLAVVALAATWTASDAVPVTLGALAGHPLPGAYGLEVAAIAVGVGIAAMWTLNAKAVHSALTWSPAERSPHD